MCLTYSEIPKTGFVATRPKYRSLAGLCKTIECFEVCTLLPVHMLNLNVPNQKYLHSQCSCLR